MDGTLPVYSIDIARKRTQNLIARKPTNMLLQGVVYPVRLSEPSMERKAQIAGFFNSFDGYEALVAFDKPFDFSILNTEYAEIDGEQFSIASAQQLDGLNCYRLTLIRC